MASAENTRPAGADDLQFDNADELQFDHAEFHAAAPTAVTCGFCRRPIDDQYYQINTAVVCDGCRQAVETAFGRGPGLFGFLKASVFGFLAAAAGAAIIYAVAAIAHISAGIISIFVGFLVGKAVRKGSGLRGGLPYQLLAVFLTYSAVAWSSLPFFLQALHEKAAVRQDAKATNLGQAKVQAPKAVAIEKDSPAKKAGVNRAKSEPVAAAAAAGPNVPRPSLLGFLGALAMFTLLLMAFAYATPFLGLSDPSSLIGLLIIFFGLQQAWRLTRKVSLTVNGPFRVGDGGLPRVEVPADA
jgi:hypothetical protein